MRPPCFAFLKRLLKQYKFKFLWKSKRDKVKRAVIYQPFSHGGVNFPDIHNVVKSLRLSWIGRFLNCTNETWQAIPNSYFNKHGGLPFLLKCNYNSKHFAPSITPGHSLRSACNFMVSEKLKLI